MGIVTVDRRARANEIAIAWWTSGQDWSHIETLGKISLL